MPCVRSASYIHMLNYVFVLNVAVVFNVGYLRPEMTVEYKLDGRLGVVLMVS